MECSSDFISVMTQNNFLDNDLTSTQNNNENVKFYYTPHLEVNN